LGVLKNILEQLDDNVLKALVKWLWPQYKRPRFGYMKNYQVLQRYFISQKILRINGKVPWPADFRSRIVGCENIIKGICCDPGDNPGKYINATGGLKIGNNVNIGQNTTITTTNHYKYDHRKTSHTKGVTIGDNVTIGAGCFISGEIPSNQTVILMAENLNIIPKTKAYEWDCTQDELG